MQTRRTSVALLLGGAVGLTGCSAGDDYVDGVADQLAKAEDVAAQADVSVLGREIAVWFAYENRMPTLSQPGGVGTEYLLDGVSIGRASTNVQLGTTGGSTITGTGAFDWCVFVTNAEGDVAVEGYSYSAEDGLQAVADHPC